MAISLTKRSVKGQPLSHTEIDQNWTDIETLVNANETALGSVLTSSYTPSGTSTVSRNIVDRLDEYPSILDYGAVGDDSTDNTTAFNNFLTDGGGYIPSGTYRIGALSNITSKVHIILHPNAVIKRKNSDSNSNMITFAAGSAGSVLEGGTIDGNKSNQTFSASHSLVRVNTVNEITIRDIKIQNSVANSILTTSSNELKLLNIYCLNNQGVLSISTTDNGIFQNITIEGTDNNGTAQNQHAFDASWCTDCIFDNITIKDHDGDASGSSTFTSGFTFLGNDFCNYSNLKYLDPLADAIYRLGLSFVGGRHNTLNGFIIEKCRNHVEIAGSEDFVISNGVIDGNYTTTTAVTSRDSLNGFLIHSGAYYSGLTSRGVSDPHRIQINNVLIKRCGDGIVQRAGHISYTDCYIIGNARRGVFCEVQSASTSFFPGASAPQIEQTVFTNCVIQANGHSGIYLEQMNGMSFIGGRITNNGQDTTASATERSGIFCSTSNTKKNIHVQGALILDHQTYTKTLGASYNPGTTDGNNRYTFTVLTPSLFALGEYIKLVSVLTGPADATGLIVDINKDELTVEFASSQTFVDNVTSGTGTISSSGTTVTGSGTSFQTEIVGRCWIKANGEYRQVVKVNSNTSLEVSSAFSTNLSGETFQRIRANIVGVPSQQYGFYYDDDTYDLNIGDNMYFNYTNNETNVVAAMQGVSVLSSKPNTFAFGSTGYIFSTGTYAASTTTNMYSSVPVGYQILGYRWMNTTAVTGTSGSSIALDLVGGATVSLDSGLGVAQNTKSSDSINPVKLTASTQLRATFSGGADNVPDGGTYKVQMMVYRTELPDFSNV